MSIFTKAFVWASGNWVVQRLLEKNVKRSQFLMGIGAGGGVSTSGERAVFRLLIERCQPPFAIPITIFDVGANTGQFLRLLSEQLAGTSYEVHCFEPGGDAFSQLAQSATGDNRVVLNKLGLGREVGEATLHYDSAGSQLASLTKRKLDHYSIDFEGAETVSITTVDEYCRQHGIDGIDLLKIDIEGHELDALAGAEDMVAAGKIGLITFEFGGTNVDTRTYFRDFWYLLTERGYTIRRITPSGYLHEIRKYSEMEEQFRTINYVAIANNTAT